MFVHRSHGVAAATLGVLAMGACTDPELNTDTRPEGPPEVLAVLVMTDPATQLYETATYCKPGDELVPTQVGLPDFTTQIVCPEDGSEVEPVANAYPDGWYVRIMFDELLDASIEELTPILDDSGLETGAFTGSIRGANPISLRCRSSVTNELIDIDYDGYYSPSGNRVTWPVGPSLVIKPNDPTLIATNTDCEITLNPIVRDKQGEEIPEAQRGPFPFRIAPISVVTIDPVDDPDGASPVDALYLYYDNAYVQFNTTVDVSSICPDTDDDGLCDEDYGFQFRDVEHPDQGPGYCDTTFTPCGTVADCDAGAGDTFCGRGYCTGYSAPCNTTADCATGELCGSTYAYDYSAFGLTDTEFGLGPINPLETGRAYTLQLNEGAILRDRCGQETTLGAATAADQTLVHFTTNAFDLNGATITSGEVSSAMKRLQFNFNNVLEASDLPSSGAGQNPSPIDTTSATPAFTISPLPKKITAPCTAAGCTTADLTAAELLIVSGNADGQTQLQGHLQMNTEYTATMKAGTVVRDFYGAEYTFEEDLVITWKTQPAILQTGITVRNTGALVGVGNNGTLVKNDAANTTDIRVGFNASINPATVDLTDIRVEPAVADLAIASVSGCGNTTAGAGNNSTGWLGTCTIRFRGTFAPGTYKITMPMGASVADIFGTTYTQAADASITVTVADPEPAASCL